MSTRTDVGSGRDPYEHLHPDVRHLALAGRSIRKACIETDRWVGYPAGDDAIRRLFELRDAPKRIRMLSVLFWAAPNMGKTFIQKHFLYLCSLLAEAELGVLVSSVFWLELNTGLTEKRLYLDILRALNVPAPDTSATRLQAMVLRQLEARGVRLILLDELQRVTELRPADQRQVLNALKYLSNQLSVSLAGFGSGEAKALMRKPTDVDREFMECLFAHSDALLGRMFRLLERAAIAALENEECVSASLIEAVALRRRRDENARE